MSGLVVVGVDPGPTPGVAKLSYHKSTLYEANVFQCDPGSLLWLVRDLLEYGGGFESRRILAVERFVVGGRASRSSTPKAGAITRNMVGALESWAREYEVAFVARSASEVKPWATDERLVKAGFALPKSMTHAKDAARHCLFAAVHDGGIPDPLSKAAKA